MDTKAIVEKIKVWMKETAKLQLEGLKRGLTIESKSTEFDLVTDVDKKSEQILISAIRKEFPDHAILSEESGSSKNNSEYLWIIDPLDGTVNYAHRFPIFAISMALQYQGDTIIGVVYIPVLEEFFVATKGGGAFLNDIRITPASETALSKTLLATGFPYDRAEDPDNNLNYFCHLMVRIGGISRSGSAAFDLCNVACGRINGYWEFKVKPWDIAAGVLIISEAGGRIDYLSGKKGIGLIAGNGSVCDSMYKELREVNPQLKIIPPPDLGSSESKLQ